MPFTVPLLRAHLSVASDYMKSTTKSFITFEKNASPNIPLFETDPDMQFYMGMNYTENIRCDYYFEDDFNEKMKVVDKSSLSMFHLNVRSLPK